MEQLPCNGCRGLCCGPVPVTGSELAAIKKAVIKMPVLKRRELRDQLRFPGTCIFYDQDNDQCGIHSSRPGVCRAFGHFSNLICFRMPEAAAQEQWDATERPAGILSVDFTWKYFE